MINKYNTESLSVEDPFGTIPSMVINESYVARENIIKFFKATTNINNWLSVPQLKTLEWYEDLITERLYLVTQYQIMRDRKGEISSVFRYLHSPVRSMIKYLELKQFTELNKKYLNLHGEMQAIDIARDIYEKLSDKLGDNTYFFQKQDDPRSEQVSSLDIVVYCYLKHQLVNIHDSKIVKMLKDDYGRLIDFVNFIDRSISIEDVYNLRISNLEYTKTSESCDVVVRNFIQSSEYNSNVVETDLYEDISQDGIRQRYVQRVYVVLMAVSFMAYLKYARNTFNS